jgi:hypothetical protein
MGSDNQSDLLGKKIFFLYPSAVIQNEIVFELIQQEFEAYIVKDHSKLRRVLKRYPDSILFVDIEEGLPEPEWESWIQGIMRDPATAGIEIGIISSKDNETIMRKYVTSVKVRAGYTVIQSEIKKTIQQLLEILYMFEAKGRRKYLRATSENEALATINMPFGTSYIKGIIKDISAAGLSCVFTEDPHLEKNSLCSDIQIKLLSALLKLEGIVFGARMDGLDKIYVLLFTQRIDPDVRIKIRKYIQHNMQAKMNAELR